jgi:hypothetical protein
MYHMILVDADTILWDAITVLDTRPTAPNTITTRTFVVYAKRPAFQGMLCEEVGDQLIHIADLPGPKEGSCKLLCEKDKIIVRYSGRLDGDLSGPFRLRKHAFDIAGVYPLDLAAAARLRNVARIIDSSVPGASPAIDPYCR